MYFAFPCKGTSRQTWATSALVDIYQNSNLQSPGHSQAFAGRSTAISQMQSRVRRCCMLLLAARPVCTSLDTATIAWVLQCPRNNCAVRLISCKQICFCCTFALFYFFGFDFLPFSACWLTGRGYQPTHFVDATCSGTWRLWLL